MPNFPSGYPGGIFFAKFYDLVYYMGCKSYLKMEVDMEYKDVEQVPGFKSIPEGIRSQMSAKEKMILVFFANMVFVRPEDWNEWVNEVKMFELGEERDHLLLNSLIVKVDGGHKVGNWFEK